MVKWVYGFGGGSAEGRADMRNLLGGKGANLAEMSSLGLPVPPGFTITTELCTYFYGNGKILSRRADGGRRSGAQSRRRACWRQIRRRRESVARVGALGRPRVDAGHDGHDPQSRPQRPHGRGACRKKAEIRALPMTLSPLHSDVRASRARSRTPRIRGCDRDGEARFWRDARYRADRRAMAERHRRLPGAG